MVFTPIESSVGGLLIGTSVIFHLLLNGRITGISGILSRTVNFKTFLTETHEWMWRISYVLGLIAAGFCSYYFLPELRPHSFPTPSAILSPTISLILYATAGLLVGLGTQLGSGCTSGHMICGIARLSVRSIVATATFCGVAFLLVKLFRTVDLFTSDESGAEKSFMKLPSTSTTITLLAVLFAVFVIYYILNMILRKNNNNNNKKKARVIYQNTEYSSVIVELISFWNAFVFGLGLSFSGMTNSAKVLGFFDVGGPAFDPSLLCVAGGAILTDLIVFQTYILKLEQPILASKFELPSIHHLTKELVIGAALFGVGWGLVGICPGPLLVNLGRGPFASKQIFVFLASLIAGFYLNAFVTRNR